MPRASATAPPKLRKLAFVRKGRLGSSCGFSGGGIVTAASPRGGSY